MDEDTNLQDQLAAAPPNAPTAQDAEAAKAASSANAASQLADIASNNAMRQKVASDPNNTGASGSYDSGRAQLTYRNAPMPEAPDLQPSPGSFGDKLHKSLLDSFAHPAAKVPGNAGLTLLSAVSGATGGPQSDAWTAAQSNADASQPTKAPVSAPRPGVFDNVLKAIGDASAGAKERGAFQGFAKTAQAMTQREREEQSDRVTMAHANSQMLHEQALTHKMGEDAIAASAVTGKQGYAAILGAKEAGTPKAQDIDSDEIKHQIDTGEIDPSKDTVFLTGRRLTGKDDNGQPLYRSTYSVITPHGPVDLTGKDVEIDKIKKYTGIDLRSKDGKKVTQVPAVQFNGLWQQASTAEANEMALKVTDAKNQKIIKEAQDSQDSIKLKTSNTLTDVLHQNTVVNKDGSPDMFARVRTYYAIMNNPDVRAKIEKEAGISDFSKAYMDANGGESYFKSVVAEYAKAQSKNQDTIQDTLQKIKTNPKELENDVFGAEAVANSVIKAPKGASGISDQDRKDAVDILQTVQEIKQSKIQFEQDKAAGKKEAEKGYQGNESATTPEAFLASLKPSEQATVKSIGEGRAGDINLAYLISRKPEVFDAVSLAYPDFDKGKITKYIEASKDFAAKKIADQLLSGGTVLQHLQEARELNTNASHIPAGPDYTAYKNKIDTLAGELGKFYGETTIPAIEGYHSTLMSTLPGSREAAILTQAKSMSDRLTGLVTRWRNASPSKVYEAQMPWISPEGQQALSKLNPEFAINYPELVKEGKQAPGGSAAQFRGKIGVEAGDKTHYFNTQTEADNFKKLAGIR